MAARFCTIFKINDGILYYQIRLPCFLTAIEDAEYKEDKIECQEKGYTIGNVNSSVPGGRDHSFVREKFDG
ncbi:hypothetical protein HPP92_008969 [Vanilla planifolia]|uniref:Uncharacterized protein n=1 Tax=Vanilla planifolia TaxID=51239 RepID=A0A835R9E5_VANPL|nr:hypothetical protein HPP92_008969 [Vanilla planifolia]